MTELLRLLASLLPAGPWFVFGDYYEHAGPIYNGWDGDEDDDEPCVCDADTPQPTYVLLPVPDAADLFAEAGRRCRNGDDLEQVGWELARNLELGRDVA